MKTTIGIAAAAALLASTTICPASVEYDADGAVPGKWTMDLDAAKKLAAEKQLPILLDFSGSDWCGWCKVMEKNVFTKPAWKTYAQENLLMVLLDYPRDKSLVPEKYVERNKALKSEYGVTGYPTFVVLDDDGKTELGRLRSGRDKTPESFQAELQSLFRFRTAAMDEYLSALNEEDRATYHKLIEKQKADKLELKAEEEVYSEARSNIRTLKQSMEDTDEQLLKLRVAQLSEDEQRQFKELETQLADARKKVSDWMKTKPDQNEENMEKYKTMQAEIKEIENKISQY